jgi:hypothetical protein
MHVPEDKLFDSCTGVYLIAERSGENSGYKITLKVPSVTLQRVAKRLKYVIAEVADCCDINLVPHHSALSLSFSLSAISRLASAKGVLCGSLCVTSVDTATAFIRFC